LPPHVALPAPFRRPTRVVGQFLKSGLQLTGRLAHPTLRATVAKPILNGRSSTAVFLNVLFADPSHRNHSARAVLNRMAEYPLALKNALRMMPQGPVPKIRHELL